MTRYSPIVISDEMREEKFSQQKLLMTDKLFTFGSLTTKQLSSELGITRSTVSHHLRGLRNKGFVIKYYDDGQWKYRIRNSSDK